MNTNCLKFNGSILRLAFYALLCIACWSLLLGRQKGWRLLTVQQPTPTTYFTVLQNINGIRMTNWYSGKAPFTK